MLIMRSMLRQLKEWLDWASGHWTGSCHGKVCLTCLLRLADALNNALCGPDTAEDDPAADVMPALQLALIRHDQAGFARAAASSSGLTWSSKYLFKLHGSMSYIKHVF